METEILQPSTWHKGKGRVGGKGRGGGFGLPRVGYRLYLVIQP